MNKSEIVRELVLHMFREVYDGNETDEEVLAINPNSYDADPSNFYEMLSDLFAVGTEEGGEAFGGFGGPVSSAISFIEAHWDGTLTCDVCSNELASNLRRDELLGWKTSFSQVACPSCEVPSPY